MLGTIKVKRGIMRKRGIIRSSSISPGTSEDKPRWFDGRKTLKKSFLGA
jgi:hypothetical protein